MIENEQYGFVKFTSMDAYNAVFELGITDYKKFVFEVIKCDVLSHSSGCR